MCRLTGCLSPSRNEREPAAAEIRVMLGTKASRSKRSTRSSRIRLRTVEATLVGPIGHYTHIDELDLFLETLFSNSRVVAATVVSHSNIDSGFTSSRASAA